MSQPHADRNLLFGILALQMDFISRDALLSAMNAWVLDKGKPLGQILQQQGGLLVEHLALLEALVQAHLKQHCNDPKESLAALSSVGTIREVLQQIADPELKASLVHVAVAREGQKDPYATDAPSVGASTSTGSRFRILRLHARGGLGQVSVAHDEELHREVALKEIQDRFADHPESRSRFLLEAEITGRLEHPGLVPVYGLGCYADGRPYYAMRFIQGDDLQDAIRRYHRQEAGGGDPRQRNLELRQLLRRFLDVCNAVAYAHSRGVLHRDLKPGNILLGKYGETLVVDWGLAKVVGRAQGDSEAIEALVEPVSGSGFDPTQMGTAIGTPAYMSPEQAAGRLDELGPASDVYSLGATLYCVLTGQAPFAEKDVGAVLRKVQQGDFPPPRQVKSEVPVALEAVCLMAMALQRGNRYTSVGDLAKEIDRWLADEPVAAHRDTWLERVGRWTRRHRAWTLAVAGSLLVITLVSFVAAFVVNRAYRKEKAEAQRARENALAVVAQTEELYKIAEERLTEARTLRESYNAKLRERAVQVKLARDQLDLANKRADDLNKDYYSRQRVSMLDLLVALRERNQAQILLNDAEEVYGELLLDDSHLVVEKSEAEVELFRARLDWAKNAVEPVETAEKLDTQEYLRRRGLEAAFRQAKVKLQQTLLATLRRRARESRITLRLHRFHGVAQRLSAMYDVSRQMLNAGARNVTTNDSNQMLIFIVELKQLQSRAIAQLKALNTGPDPWDAVRAALKEVNETEQRLTESKSRETKRTPRGSDELPLARMPPAGD